jgi:DNA-directed RNA polymerase subunit RPC12/RpoP
MRADRGAESRKVPRFEPTPPSIPWYCRGMGLRFDSEKNRDVQLSQLRPHSHKKYWFVCEDGHSLQISIESFTRGVGCAFCLNRKVLEGYNDLATTHPHLAEEWDTLRNSPLTPREVIAGSATPRHWICPQGHRYIVSGNQRLYGYNGKGRGCGICSGRILEPGVNDLKSSGHPTLTEWHPKKNTPLLPSQISPSSNKRVWWLCRDCGHEWQASPNSRIRRDKWTKCPACTGRLNIRRAEALKVGVNDLKTLFPDLISQWDYEANGDLNPSNLLSGSNRKAWWTCELGHKFQQQVSSRTLAFSGCPYCSGQKVLEGFNDFATKAPNLLAEWDFVRNEALDPFQTSPGSTKKAWWTCGLGHSYLSSIANRYYLDRGCPYCGHRKVLIGFNEIASKHPEVAMEWDFGRNKLTPDKVMSGSNAKVYWICESGHSYRSTPNSRTGEIRTGCAVCKRVGGFIGTLAGRLYFIKNERLLAFKIGITNHDSRRLQIFGNLGWRTLGIWKSEDGYALRDLESNLMRWIRAELALPEYLGAEEMRVTGGHTETFSSEAVSERTVLAKIESLASQVVAIEAEDPN